MAPQVGLTSGVGYIYRHLNVSATKGQGERVVSDQIRRLKDEMDWFENKKDAEYLHTVVYRNLREINVWLAWADNVNPWVPEIKNAVSRYKLPPNVRFTTMFIFLMKYFPKELYYLQRWVNRTRRRIKSLYS